MVANSPEKGRYNRMSFILLIGRPGTGKTTLACSMTKLGYKVRLIDVDNKAYAMYNIKHLIEKDQVRVIPIKSRLVETKLKDRFKELHVSFQAAQNKTRIAPTKAQPEGYLEYCDIISIYEDEMSKGNKSEEEVLVVDSFTSLLEHMKRLVLYIQKQDKFSYDEWEIWKTNIEEFISIHSRLQGYFKHVIIISHEQMEKDELVGKIEIVPMIDGSMKFKIGKDFTEIYHTIVEVPTAGKPKYKVVTVPKDRCEARTSRNIEMIEEADFSVLFADELPEDQRKKIEKLRQLKEVKKNGKVEIEPHKD
jgi:adenylate kinase family enzyme